jgi:hypothetical protein
LFESPHGANTFDDEGQLDADPVPISPASAEGVTIRAVAARRPTKAKARRSIRG